MEKSLGDFFAVILVLFLLIIGGYMMASMRKRLFLDSFPVGEKRKFIMDEIMSMTQGHEAHADKLKFLRRQGMSKSVAKALLGEADQNLTKNTAPLQKRFRMPLKPSPRLLSRPAKKPRRN